ncbi:branched-chain amino acid ABC transporter substrate-binding protein [Actinocorallia lasiicapitis]
MNSRSASAAVLAGLLALTTAACGGSDADKGSGSGEGGPVKIGALLSMSGVYSTLGPAQRNAITMGVEELNKTGFTVDGKKHTFEVSYADDKSDPATTGVTALREMSQAQDLPVIAYGLGSATYVPQLKRNPVAMINILDSTYPSVITGDEHQFLTRGAATTYVPGCLFYAKRKLGAKSISIITAKGEPYGEGNTKLVEKSAADEGIKVGASSSYPLGATDYSNAIGAATAAKPDAIYLSSVTGVILPVLKQLRQSGYTGPVLHSSGVNADQAKAILGGQFDSIMKDNYDCAGTLPTTSQNPAAKSFADAYQAKFNAYPQDLTMWAYDYPFVVAEAMAKTGTVSDPEKITKALNEIKVPAGTVSGWIAAPGSGLMFSERGARTASEVTAWCAGSETIDSALTFDVQNDKIVTPVFAKDACK